MFDLDTAIGDWRARLAQGGQCLDGDLVELEEHLREQIDALAATGLSDEEAFLVSARRLGQVDLLDQEFGKVNAPAIWVNRFRWMAVGLLIWWVASIGATLLSRTLVTGGLAIGLPGSAAAVFAVVAKNVLLLILIAVPLSILVHGGRKRGNLLPRAAWIRVVVFVGLLAWFVLAPIASHFCNLFAVRVGGCEEYGQAVIRMAVGSFVGSMVFPILVAGWLLLAPRRVRSA